MDKELKNAVWEIYYSLEECPEEYSDEFIDSYISYRNNGPDFFTESNIIESMLVIAKRIEKSKSFNQSATSQKEKDKHTNRIIDMGRAFKYLDSRIGRIRNRERQAREVGENETLVFFVLAHALAKVCK